MNPIKPGMVVDLVGKTKEEILHELVRIAATDENVTDEEALFDAIMERENEYTTGIGLGIAVPHAKIDSVKSTVVVLGRSKEPIDFQALDDMPVSIFALIAVNESMHKEYIRVLAKIALFLKDEESRDKILAAPSVEAVAQIVDEIL